MAASSASRPKNGGGGLIVKHNQTQGKNLKKDGLVWSKRLLIADEGWIELTLEGVLAPAQGARDVEAKQVGGPCQGARWSGCSNG